jgi:hypothetical protein
MTEGGVVLIANKLNTRGFAVLLRFVLDILIKKSPRLGGPVVTG